jgi:DNA-directed RNA polymerase specialized sigma24 family protein
VNRWPLLNEHYEDEFGPIAPEVYAVAGALWPRAERFAMRTLRDDAAGITLLLRASALVSRHRARGGVTQNLSAYLFQTFRRLTLAELDKEKGRRRLEEERYGGSSDADDEALLRVEQLILLQQIRDRMDPWTLQVFEWRVLGHSFDEIGWKLNRNGNAVRNRFRSAVRLIVPELGRHAK